MSLRNVLWLYAGVELRWLGGFGFLLVQWLLGVLLICVACRGFVLASSCDSLRKLDYCWLSGNVACRSFVLVLSWMGGVELLLIEWLCGFASYVMALS